MRDVVSIAVPCDDLRKEVRGEVNPADWDAAVASLGGSVFHSYDWTRYRCLNGHHEPRFFLWRGAAATPVAAAVDTVRDRFGFDAIHFGRKQHSRWGRESTDKGEQE